jgi:anthranilate phosphoribosyltransferase
MNPTDAIRETGRGRYSARPLTREQARSIFGQMLDGSIDPLRLGALLMAWRIKGESADELAGFLDATHDTIARPGPDALDPARPLVVIPSYNGARSRPNLLPLLALALRDAGLQVLVHGVLEDPRRVTSAQVFAAMGEPRAGSLDEALDRLRSHALAFIGIDALSPRLAGLLALRWQLGVRSSGHTVVKMLDPVPSAALRLVSVTHPEYVDAMRAYYTTHPSRVLLMRGTEGEAVRRLQNPQAVEYLDAGGCRTVLPAEEADTPPVAVDALDAASTARWIREALDGRHGGIPAAIRAQVDVMAGLARP